MVMVIGAQCIGQCGAQPYKTFFEVFVLLLLSSRDEDELGIPGEEVLAANGRQLRDGTKGLFREPPGVRRGLGEGQREQRGATAIWRRLWQS